MRRAISPAKQEFITGRPNKSLSLKRAVRAYSRTVHRDNGKKHCRPLRNMETACSLIYAQPILLAMLDMRIIRISWLIPNHTIPVGFWMNGTKSLVVHPAGLHWTFHIQLNIVIRWNWMGKNI